MMEMVKLFGQNSHLFLSHVVDEHENLDNAVFNKCGHKDIIQPRKWLDKGTAHIS